MKIKAITIFSIVFLMHFQLQAQDRMTNYKRVGPKVVARPIARILEFSSSLHITAILYGAEVITVGDLVNINFDVGKSCTLEVIDSLPNKMLVFASTNDCPYESKIKVGMEVTRSVIPAGLKKKIFAQKQERPRFDPVMQDYHGKFNSILYRPGKNEYAGQTSFEGFASKYEAKGYDKEVSVGQLWQTLAVGIDDKIAFDLEVGYQYSGERKSENTITSKKIEGILEPVLGINGEIFNIGDLKGDAIIKFSPKLKNQDYDTNSDERDAVRGGSYFFGEFGIGEYLSNREHRLAVAVGRHFTQTRTVDGEDYSESGEYTETLISNDNRFFVQPRVGIDLNFGYSYVSDEKILYYDNSSIIARGYSSFIIGTGVYGLFSPTTQIFFKIDLHSAFGDVSVESSEGEIYDYKLKDPTAANVTIGLKYGF